MTEAARQIARAAACAGAALVVSSALPAQSRSCSSPALASGDAAVSVWTGPLDRRITVHANDLSLRDALGRVAATAKVRLSYSAELLPLDRAVCVSADGVPVGRVLSELLSGAAPPPA